METGVDEGITDGLSVSGQIVVLMSVVSVTIDSLDVAGTDGAAVEVSSGQ